MVISVLQHGLGNQFFQYAVGRAVADRLNTTLLLDKTRFAYNGSRGLGITRFRIRARMLPDPLAKLLTPEAGASRWKTWLKKAVGGRFRTFEDPEQGYDARIFSQGRWCRLDGHWQSERYFAHLRPQLLEEFEPEEPLPEPLISLSQRMASEDSVAVHVRRGNLVSSAHYAAAIGTLAPAYYAEAMARLRARIPAVRFYVFSDDPAWCEECLPRIGPVEVISGKMTASAVQDLTVMKHCRHFIIANSTFSWWAAWLGNHPSKQVIAPARFFRQPAAWENDLRPAGWETVEPVFEDLR